MKRDPSIHIKQSDLVLVIKQLSKQLDIYALKHKELAEVLVKGSRRFSAANRAILNATELVDKKVKKINSSKIGDANLFAQLISAKRKAMKHRNVQLIKPGTQQWLMIKEIASLANDFAEEFDMGRREAYITYITIGLSKMKKYSLHKFLSLSDVIGDTYNATKELETDNSVQSTTNFYNIYKTAVVNRTGLPVEYHNDPIKYVHFLHARREADRLNVSYYHYLESQFQAFDNGMGYPDPLQLVGDKSIVRLSKYMAKKGLTVKKEDPKNNVNFDFLKHERE